MEPATISALASSVSAAAAWFAFGSTTRRAKNDWQRNTVLQAAVTILQACQERHNREHELLQPPLQPDGGLTPELVTQARAELEEISNRVEQAHIQLSLVATPKVTRASRAILDLMTTLDADVLIFEHDYPDGGVYNGAFYCLEQGIGRDGVEPTLRRALRQYTTTPTQRIVERLRQPTRR
ncbi:hypothetical protein [Mycobacterium intracellulare]|uniref:hypothetical protein n=1 Tax=Mycobacterium intracellulare TaxID=1767 RepID=UPI001914EBE7|nr:hypothetical protein [Mycobacterium intracellulare]MCA2355763.1 hypothetical protein [Mycobacterium intracellulare]MCA2365989.1 hypothetical protein [Mycobacterium intracellulare]